MAPRKMEMAPALVAEGRRLYEHTVMPVRDIALKLGISNTTLQNRIDEWGWKRRDYHSELMRKLRAAEVAASEARAPAPGSRRPPSRQPLSRRPRRRTVLRSRPGLRPWSSAKWTRSSACSRS